MTTALTATTATTAHKSTHGSGSSHWETRLFNDPSSGGTGPRSRGWEVPVHDAVDHQLADSPSRLHRVSARAAFQEVLHGRAVLVDIRPAAQRTAEGEVAAHLSPLLVERNVLESRFDPRSPACLEVAGLDTRVLVLCQEGYTSSLAADALLRLGIRRATDVVGGYRAWREAGLATSGPAGQRGAGPQR